MRNVWKWVGLAGVAGVVAGGALVARDQRKRRAYTPDEVRARLHQRLDESDVDGYQSRSGRVPRRARTGDSCRNGYRHSR
ncbi:hypothetical protein [Mycobacterium tuberculosis]|uniref:hypothetical protein n=1 Tax=Mycobacterium tuberculosis TaxID=1773 RepID=UPI001F41E974|nr:hypothetical protein [Mycobacterium tuberculosis]